MNRRSWIFFVAGRYLSARKRDKSSPSSIFAILGIAVGVLALTVVLAVMNGFQLGFIESILEISSYHLRAETAEPTRFSPEIMAGIAGRPEVEAVLPFVDLQALATGQRGVQEVAAVRGIPSDAATADPALAKKLGYENGAFKLGPHEAMLGAELARILGLDIGDAFSLTVLSGAALAGTTSEDSLFRVTALFRSGFYEYDLSWVFIEIDDAYRLAGGSAPTVYGIKLKNRWGDVAALSELRRWYPSLAFESWREYNRSFFGALRTEKVMMFLLVGLIFLIVAVNVFQAQRRVVFERRDEIGLLRAVGANTLAVRLVFTGDGLAIGLAGALGGLLPGILIATHIDGFFAIMETVVNGFFGAINTLLTLFGSMGTLGNFTIFSPAVFYIKQVPAVLIPGEIVLVFLFGCLSATGAAWFASGKVARIRPAEVLRDE